MCSSPKLWSLWVWLDLEIWSLQLCSSQQIVTLVRAFISSSDWCLYKNSHLGMHSCKGGHLCAGGEVKEIHPDKCLGSFVLVHLCHCHEKISEYIWSIRILFFPCSRGGEGQDLSDWKGWCLVRCQSMLPWWFCSCALQRGQNWRTRLSSPEFHKGNCSIPSMRIPLSWLHYLKDHPPHSYDTDY